jgi:uncharacterized membrane protein
MRRINLFLTLTIASLASLIATVVAGYFVLSASTNQADNWGNMWNGMMGSYSGTQAQAANAMAPYFNLALVISVVFAVLGISGLIYFLAFPQIRNIPHGAQAALTTGTIAASTANSRKIGESDTTPINSVLKTMTEDERKVVEVLTAHNGNYLQKYIRSEAGLSRLQTHRIVARLAGRGIVTLEKTGNTNAVKIADWLQ